MYIGLKLLGFTLVSAAGETCKTIVTLALSVRQWRTLIPERQKANKVNPLVPLERIFWVCRKEGKTEADLLYRPPKLRSKVKAENL